MKNGDRIRHMSDIELAEFMRLLERGEIPYWQGECKECVNRPCDDCRIRWLDTDPDEFKEDPTLFETILEVVDILFSGESTYQRATLAGEVYRQIRSRND